MNQILEKDQPELLFPPPHLNKLGRSIPTEFPDNICYKNHPYYIELIKSANFKTKIKSITTFGTYFLFISIKRLLTYERIPAHLRNPKFLIDFFIFFKRSLINNYHRLFSSILLPKSKMDVYGNQIFASLNEQGICVIAINPNQFDKIEQLSSPFIEKLRAERNKKTNNTREFSESRCTILRPSNEEIFQAIESCFNQNGIFAGIEKHLGRPVQLIDINPQINDPSDNFWQEFFSDLQGAEPQTAYCHRDASGGDVKVILYLSDVAADNGPFSFVLGSHKYRPRGLHNFIQEINDSSGLSSSSLNARRSFSALPDFLRKKCAFGNDLQSNSDIAKKILAAEWQIISNKGRAVIFDSKGIHRGGMVLNKERVVLTCIIG